VSPRVAFLFPGQGSQYVGMGKRLADSYPTARKTFEEADDALGFPLAKLCFEGPVEELRRTEKTPPALLAVSVAAFRVFERGGFATGIVAGHSLGAAS